MNRKILLGILYIFSVCMALAFITDHRWEDWYITFRASKNLALGNGLVFNIGERIMTYTSPIGTLIPALIKYTFANFSDDITIWVYRIVCSIVLAMSMIPIYRIIEHLKLDRIFYWFSMILLSLSFIIVDNTINGMESAFMVFFESYLTYLLITKPANFEIQLGVVFANMMYSRPDGFIYAGALIAGFMIFSKLPSTKISLLNLKGLLRSIGIAALLFAPWFFWTWYYYGTPIPHTIIAKSKSYNLDYFIQSITNYISHFKGSADIYLAPYGENFGGWGLFETFARIMSVISLFYWLNWKGNSLARALSFATLAMILYLNIVSGQGPAPWYLPAVAAPSLLIWVFIFSDLKLAIPFKGYYLIQASFLIMLSANFFFAMRMIRAQQRIIEFGNRKEIGMFLNKNKGPEDTIFMECLGYIGFYSELKTYDFPGMSSPEMVATRKRLKTNQYGHLIQELKPTWVSIRPIEVENINKQVPTLLSKQYKLVRIFDRRIDVAHAKITYGQPYLDFDAVFYLYKRI